MRAHDFVLLGIIALLLVVCVVGYNLVGQGLRDALADNQRLAARVLELEGNFANISTGIGSVITGIEPVATGLGDGAERLGSLADNLGRAEAIIESSRVVE